MTSLMGEPPMVLRLLAKVFPSRPPEMDLDSIRLHLTADSGEILGSTSTPTIYVAEFAVTEPGWATHVRDNRYQKLWTLSAPVQVMSGDIFTFRGHLNVSVPAA